MRAAVVADVHAEIDARPSNDAIVRWVSGNTGNLAFQTVLPRLLDDPVARVSWHDDPRQIAGRADLLVIPEASVLTASKDFGWKADFIDQADLPCLAVGVGRQAEIGDATIGLPAGTRRYMRVLSERSQVIGVRGACTAKVLAGIGVRNTEVLGCPSLFWSAATTRAIPTDRTLRIAVNPGPDRRSLRSLHRVLSRWLAGGTNGAAIAQSGRLLRLALSDSPRAALAGGRLPFRRGRYAPLHAFLDVPTWMSYLERFDITVGARIHGALLSVAAGTPAVCVVHDDRTRELAETCRLPTARPRDVARASSLRDLLDDITFDWSDHMQVRRDLATAFCDVLTRTGLRPSRHLEAVAGRAAAQPGGTGVQARSTAVQR